MIIRPILIHQERGRYLVASHELILHNHANYHRYLPQSYYLTPQTQRWYC